MLEIKISLVDIKKSHLKSEEGWSLDYGFTFEEKDAVSKMLFPCPLDCQRCRITVILGENMLWAYDWGDSVFLSLLGAVRRTFLSNSWSMFWYIRARKKKCIPFYSWKCSVLKNIYIDNSQNLQAHKMPKLKPVFKEHLLKNPYCCTDL